MIYYIYAAIFFHQFEAFLAFASYLGFAIPSQINVKFKNVTPCLNLLLTMDGYMIWLMALSGSLAKSLYTALWTMNVMRSMTPLMMEKMTETANPDWFSYNWRFPLAQETFMNKRSPWSKVLFDMLTLIFVS